MKHFPIFLDLNGRPVLVAGGGGMAALRTRQLLRAGARVHVVAPALGSELAALAEAGELTHSGGGLAAADFTPADPADEDTGAEDLTNGESNNWALAVGAAEDAETNRQVYDWARRRGIPVNVVDRPNLCTFIMPAIVDRSPVLIAVSTGGASPTLSRLLRERLEALVPGAYGKLAQLAQGFRSEVKRLLPTMHERQRFWQRVLTGSAGEAMLAGREEEARAALAGALEDAARGETQTEGIVWLVGAGPGDPELLTLRALRVLQQADVIVYDRLVSDEILALARPQAERIYAGKAPGDPHTDQAHIHALLVEHARAGKRVVRLKGGDPFIFGRGGEEREALMLAGIPVHIVPGITAAIGCAASAGIPLTHRDHAHQCVFVAGHRCGETLELDWTTLTRPNQTLVFYMGARNLPEICTQLALHGLSGDTPAALIHEGTTPRERTLRATVATLPALASEFGLGAPALLIVGAVVGSSPAQLDALLAAEGLAAGRVPVNAA